MPRYERCDVLVLQHGQNAGVALQAGKLLVSAGLLQVAWIESALPTIVHSDKLNFSVTGHHVMYAVRDNDGAVLGSFEIPDNVEPGREAEFIAGTLGPMLAP